MRDYKPIYFSLNVNVRTFLEILTFHKLTNVLRFLSQLLEQLLGSEMLLGQFNI